MTMAPVPVALVDDDEDMRVSIGQILSLAGYQVSIYPDAASALSGIADDFPGVVLSDIRMPGMSGIELFRALHSRDSELPVVLLTGHGDVDTAVDTLKAGAWDFLTKPCTPETLLGAIARAASARTLVVENRRLRILAEAAGADDLIGRSPAMRRLRATIAAVADSDLDIVIEGATGTGKQLLARLVHRASKRARQRLVTFDCAVPPLPPGGDVLVAHGLLSRGHRGTVFLDNLERADPQLQHRLAQFAEHRAVALDAREPETVDARIIAAIDEGARERIQPSLYHRIAAVSLRIPPLSEREEDVPLLIAHFAGQLSRTHRRPEPSLTDLATLMARREWPGNVRELEMAVERHVLGLGDGADEDGARSSLPNRVRAFERTAIIEAVIAAKGDVSRASQALGIPRETFYYRTKRLGIDLLLLRKGGL